MTGLKDESINTEGVILLYDLIKISVGRHWVTQFLLLILPAGLKGLEFELLIIKIIVTRSSLREDEGLLAL